MKNPPRYARLGGLVTQPLLEGRETQMDLSQYNEISYHPLAFVVTSLPIAPLPAGEIWVKTNGDYTLSLNPATIKTLDGYDNTLPSGKIARAILHYLTTEARRTGTHRITLPTSHRQLLKKLGIPASGANVKETILQLRKVLSMSVQFTVIKEETAQTGKHERSYEDVQFTIAFSSQLRTSRDDTELAPGSVIELSEPFVEHMVRQNIFPVNEERWGALLRSTKSSLALDIFLWLSYRLPNLREDQEISWEALGEQFGSQQKNTRVFRSQFLKALDVVREHYPQANVEEIGKGSRGGRKSGVRLSRSAPVLARARVAEALGDGV